MPLYIAENVLKTEHGTEMATKDFSYPSLKRSSTIIKKYFSMIVKEQELFTKQAHCDKILEFIKDMEVRSKIYSEM